MKPAIVLDRRGRIERSPSRSALESRPEARKAFRPGTPGLSRILRVRRWRLPEAMTSEQPLRTTWLGVADDDVLGFPEQAVAMSATTTARGSCRPAGICRRETGL